MAGVVGDMIAAVTEALQDPQACKPGGDAAGGEGGAAYAAVAAVLRPRRGTGAAQCPSVTGLNDGVDATAGSGEAQAATLLKPASSTGVALPQVSLTLLQGGRR